MAEAKAVADAKQTEVADEANEGAAAPPAGIVARLKHLTLKQKILFGAPLVLLFALGIAGIVGVFDPVLIELGLIKPPDDGRYIGPTIYVDMPDMIVNLDAPQGQIRMLRASISIEVPTPDDKVLVRELMPRIQDAMQTRLRALTPDDLKGTAQTFRLRQELLQRVAGAIGSEHVKQVWFRDLLVR